MTFKSNNQVTALDFGLDGNCLSVYLKVGFS